MRRIAGRLQALYEQELRDKPEAGNIKAKPGATSSPDHREQPFQMLNDLNSTAARTIFSALKGDELRLVRLHPGAYDDALICSLEVYQRGESPEYTALSYVCKCNERVLTSACAGASRNERVD
jgi:hypothetical protein